MELKWLCIVFAFVSTLRLSEGQITFTSAIGRDYGIVYHNVADEIIGFIEGTCADSSGSTAIDVVTSSSTYGCYVVSQSAAAYVGDGTNGNYESIQSAPSGTPITIHNYIAPASIATADVDYNTAAATPVVTLGDTLSSGSANFVYDCGEVDSQDDTNTEGTYFQYSSGVQWKIALAGDDLLFRGTIRCLFSNQDGANYGSSSTESLRIVVDITLDPPLAADNALTCSLNPTMEGTGSSAVVGTYSAGTGTGAGTTCTATTTPMNYLTLENEANCYGRVMLESAVTLAYDTTDSVELVIASSVSTATATCTLVVLKNVAAPTCESSISARVDLQQWRASSPASGPATVLVDKAIATSPGRELDYTIDSSTTNSDNYAIAQNTLQLTESAARSVTDGDYTVLVAVTDADDSSLNTVCTVTLTVGPGVCP